MSHRTRRLVLAIAPLILAAAPSLAQQSDPFQSNTGSGAASQSPSRSTHPEGEGHTSHATTGLAAFDGTYKGGAPAIGPCPEAMIEADVGRGMLSGLGTTAKTKWRLQGTVSADGSFSGLNGTQVLIGKFQDGVFEGSYMSANAACGRRPITLRRTTP
jgi:hypothetical protein